MRKVRDSARPVSRKTEQHGRRPNVLMPGSVSRPKWSVTPQPAHSGCEQQGGRIGEKSDLSLL